MALEITVPEVSEGVHQGTVVSVAVAKGDHVEADQTLMELETDKAVVAIPSPQAGVITEIKVKEGDEVEVGAVIMLIDAEGDSEPDSEASEEPAAESDSEASEEPAAEPDSEASEEPAAESDSEDSEEPAAESDSEASEEPAAETDSEASEEPAAETDSEDSEEPAAETDSEDSEKPAAETERKTKLDLSIKRRDDQVAPAAPSVRRKARELGVDIYQVQGTGPGGRISESDIRRYVRETMQQISSGAVMATGGPQAQRQLPDFTRWGKISREPLSKVRQITADAMSYAWTTIPMVTQYDQARVTEIEKYRNEFNAKATDDAKLTMTAILVKICAEALKTFPQFNSSLDLANKELILKHSIHIGVAVDTPRGLMVPVLRDVENTGLEKLASDLNAIAAKTREQKITPADLEGGSFTISNLGGIGGTAFTPIVYAPQVAILGVSRTETQPVWDGREFKPQLVLPLSLTYDHRVIDGADGARFLRWICATLENPLQLVMKG